MSETRRLLIATSNKGKVQQLRAVLAAWGVNAALVTPADLDLPLDFDPEEIGETFAENAAIKAVAYASISDLPALADDSGLSVDALGGAPGVHSARYAPDAQSRIDKLLAALSQMPDAPRDAHYTTVLTLALPADNAVGAQVVAEETGILHGQIIDEMRGTNGFGYDPIFYIPEYERTLGELDTVQLEAVNHRGQAARAMAQHLNTFLDDFYGA